VTFAQTKPRVAVVGAGIAGLACARELAARGAWVTVFEEGRAAGGRATTQVGEAGAFDHGAQYFTVSNHRFEPIAQRWVDCRLVRRWRGRIIAFSNGELIDKTSPTERFVGVPGMSAIGRFLAEGLEVRLNTRVRRMQRRGGLWLLHDERGRELSVSGFDIVCLAVPSPQAVQLLAGQSELGVTLARIDWEPCWAAMLALARASGLDFDGAFVNDDPILGWIARDSAKPDRSAIAGIAERWVLHARPKWSREYFSMEPARAAQWLARAFSARVGRAITPHYLAAHRWRYATPVNPVPTDYLWDEPQKIGMAGDWCNGARVEAAYLSGHGLAEAIARQ
jgi:predicted NAD/FAD-dependent oxidoreductase